MACIVGAVIFCPILQPRKLRMARYISQHFTAAENSCRCGECDKATADVELVALLEMLRCYYWQAIKVRSWFRCRSHNNRPTTEFNTRGVRGVGSGDYSWHLLGGACDISIARVSPIEIRDLVRARYPGKYGVGVYDWGVHLDVRLNRADWDNRSNTTPATTFI